MKISFNAIEKVTYACWLNEEDSLKVAEYMEDYDVSVEEAVEELYAQGEINPYEDCNEVDCFTEEFYNGEVEYDDEEDE